MTGLELSQIFSTLRRHDTVNSLKYMKMQGLDFCSFDAQIEFLKLVEATHPKMNFDISLQKENEIKIDFRRATLTDPGSWMVKDNFGKVLC